MTFILSYQTLNAAEAMNLRKNLTLITWQTNRIDQTTTQRAASQGALGRKKPILSNFGTQRFQTVPSSSAGVLQMAEKNGSSGRTRTYNPPVNSLVGRSKSNNFAPQMTTHGDVETRKVRNIVTLI
jgi:hypothetical protein